MRKFITLQLFLLLSFHLLPAQGFTDSNLPIMIITTDGGIAIPDEPKILGSMKLIYRGPGERNFVSDQDTPGYLNYDGRIKIEIRGSSTQFAEKKQYSFTTLLPDDETDNDVDLLHLPDENDWIINGMVFDSAHIRDYISYNLSRQIGQYASRTAYCEVIINGEYRGLYLLQEKLKADKNRINIVKISASDNAQPELSGGYITKADKTTGGDPIAWTMSSWNGATIGYIHELPKPENVTEIQSGYIRSRFTSLELSAMNGDASPVNGFPALIDMTSFIDYMILNELASNADAYTFSTFFHKDRNGKLRAGPIWDFDLTFGNDLFLWGFDRSKPDYWQLSNGENDGSRFWKDLFENSLFRCYLARRWNELTSPGMPLNESSINDLIDNAVTQIGEAIAREDALWSNIGDFSERIAQVKSFINARIAWINGNIGSFEACSNIVMPPLVISKIMYNPESTVEFPDEDDLEFIEITNTGDADVNTSGFYFPGTGFVFQFPQGSVIRAHSHAILASNAEVFESKYGFQPFGQFTPNLSNKSQLLILADPFGNVIDSVRYLDVSPWPDADGNGYYLDLVDPVLDNGLASSWTSSFNTIFSVDELSAGYLNLYPNPVKGSLNVVSEFEIEFMRLYDLAGRLLAEVRNPGYRGSIDLGHYSNGIYILKVSAGKGIQSRKIVKN